MKDWDKAKKFLEDTKNKRVHIFSDYDQDGIGGGLVLYHTLSKLGAHATVTTKLGRGASLHKEELKKIRETINPEIIIINDQDPKSYHEYENLRETFPKQPILIIDHHAINEYKDALFIHPKIEFGIEGYKMCSAKVVYDLCNETTPIPELAWLACIGILGDVNTETYKEFLEETLEREGFEITKDPYAGAFGLVAEAIDCVTAVGDEELQTYFEQLSRAHTLSEAVDLGNPRKDVKEEVNKYLQIGMDIGETHGAVTFIPIESEFSITGWVLTILSINNPNKILIGYRETPDAYSLNARFQQATVHLGEIIRPIAESMEGRGGGHAPAAGAGIPKEHWEEFKKQFINKVQEELDKVQLTS